ncbi:MAG: I78 family peptidase inhibitor [Bauldia sp.]
MNKLPIVAMLGGSLALAGCVMTPVPPGPPPPPPGGPCVEANADLFVGQVATPGVQESARIAANATIVRTIAPGQVVTMEFSANRLTLDVNAGNVITNGRCG